MHSHCMGKMKDKTLNIRMSQRRLDKLLLYSVQKDRTMTQIIEDFIDTLKLENGNSSDIPKRVEPYG